ncbi:MAG: hypothetical protein R6V45_13180 [Oceanipulchritudo sp.]
MKLTDEQKAAVAGWLREGASLSEVQKRLESEFEIRMTYMDLRFLVDDLDLEIQSEAPTFDEPVSPAVQGGEPGGAGGVSVTLDKVSRPDALVSGQVTFSDGQSAQWHLDQMGRLAMNPQQPGYKPTDADLQQFQEKLRDAVEKSGMF